MTVSFQGNPFNWPEEITDSLPFPQRGGSLNWLKNKKKALTITGWKGRELCFLKPLQEGRRLQLCRHTFKKMEI